MLKKTIAAAGIATGILFGSAAHGQEVAPAAGQTGVNLDPAWNEYVQAFEKQVGRPPSDIQNVKKNFEFWARGTEQTDLQSFVYGIPYERESADCEIVKAATFTGSFSLRDENGQLRDIAKLENAMPSVVAAPAPGCGV